MSHEQPTNLSNTEFPNPHPDLWRQRYIYEDFDTRPIWEVRSTDLEQPKDPQGDKDWTDLLTLPNLSYSQQLIRRQKLMRILSESIASEATDIITRKRQELQRDYLASLLIGNWMVQTEGLVPNEKINTHTLLSDWLPDSL